MTSQHKANILLALQRLAGVCDGAHQRDDVGFSANHTNLGNGLSALSSLTDEQAQAGLEIVMHYSRQLGDLHSTIMVESVERAMEHEDEKAKSPQGAVGPDKFEREPIILCKKCNKLYKDHHNEDHPFLAWAELDPAGYTITELPKELDSKPGIPNLVLTQEQQSAVDTILAFIEDGPSNQFKLGGYAGTGKTTVIRWLLDALRKEYVVQVCAFTGKAVNVLQRKGIPARTMHSLLYDVVEDAKTHEISFVRKVKLESEPDIIIVDESSMVSTELYNQLTSWGLKYIFVGDPGQLEPIGDNPNLMKSPDLVLSHIHRQAANSPIISLANTIRTGGNLIFGDQPGLTVRRKTLSGAEFVSCDQVIVAKNATRKDFNTKARAYKGFMTSDILVGDKLIVLRNNLNLGVYNGMLLEVKEIRDFNGFRWDALCEDELGHSAHYPIWYTPFRDPTFDPAKQLIPKIAVYCDFGYAITCHKSQGSEWSKVLVWDEVMPAKIWDMKRWRYTAITRASQHLIYNV